MTAGKAPHWEDLLPSNGSENHSPYEVYEHMACVFAYTMKLRKISPSLGKKKTEDDPWE